MRDSTWQPMTTAPKDGSPVLLYVPQPPNESFHTGSTAMPDELQACKYFVGCYGGRPHDDNGWWVSHLVSFDHGYYPGEFDWEAETLIPTGWMPLPEAPK